jgi:Glycosidases
MNILTIVFSWLLLACTKKNDFAPAPVNDDPVQYGTPYAQVPDAADAVIYQVNLRAFSKSANFKGLQERLDSIRALGVNVLYLMPVYPIGAIKSVNSPYCVKDYMAVNPEFGTLDDLRTLVDAAHQRQMAVMMDWVANHTAWDNAWINNKSWYAQDGNGNIISPPGTGWNDVAQLNFQNADMRKAMISAIKYWIYTANIDGYRCDAADFVPQDFWKQAIDSLRGITTHKLLLLAEGSRNNHFSTGFDLMYGMGFYYNMVNNIFKKHGAVSSVDSVNAVEYTNAAPGNRVVRYTSNHDVNHTDGTPLDLLGGRQGSLAAFTVAAYWQTAPMLYNGQEVGCPVKLNFFNSSTTIDWSINADMKAAYKKIIGFRNSSEAVKRGQLTAYAHADVCAFMRSLNNEKVLVIANCRNTPVQYTLPFAISNWKNIMTGNDTSINGDITLAPYEYMILQQP